jgi:hypothetical protein
MCTFWDQRKMTWAPRIYCVLFECGKVYVGQTDCTTETRSKEHAQCLCLYPPGYWPGQATRTE